MRNRTLCVLVLASFAAMITTARADMLYVAVNNKIVTYDTTSPTPAGVLFATTGVQPNEGLAFDSAGNLYVDMATTGAVLKYAPDGTGSPFAGFNGVGQGLVINAAGDVFVADANNKIIREIAPDGTVTTFGSVTGTPIGLAFDSSGDLFVVNQGNRTLWRFTPGGVGSLFASDFGSDYPSFLAFQPVQAVPEPSSLALALIGVAAAGVGYRNRRSRKAGLPRA